MIFVLGALIVGAALQFTGDAIAPASRPKWTGMKFLPLYAAEIEVVNAGNSLNRAIDYHQMGLRGFHLWDGGADLLEASYVLRTITPTLPKLKAVLVPVNPLSFRTDNTLVGRDAIRRQVYAAMPSLASWRPVRGDAGNLMRGKLSSIVREDHWREVFEAAGGSQSERTRRLPSFQVDETGYLLPYVRRSVGRDSQRIEELEGFFRELEQSVRAHPSLPEHIYREFSAVIAGLRARGIRVILFSPPYLEVVNQLFARQATELTELKASVGRLSREYGVEYLDYSTDADFVDRPGLFMSEDHLNKFGAELFSRKLNELLLAKKRPDIPK
jgi:hypothetical protein